MSDKPKKKRFEVEDHESISDCLDRMDKEGYQPVRRMEEPVFIEVKEGKTIIQKVHKQKIVFEGILKQENK
ncbi:NETI protein [Schinkia azotoformans MEV2011]|uniref:NETI protein n=1 Tax=Schinkia azotoformans MEV2011 TaxID=1348973 RepID=A0A072NFC5_SCHAZ|nr:NETI motif-containing protein [Schinkia azotoformans]KEF36241.1 NETI protein [Schinkia azotoformans MEV2011]MEC1693844.1 NETI motif-containing protein [Schinkia azotoformans]MEC1714655.1 NETI motif-containing protein [Schinkia azotoformans]MEC1724811.1 NETI motif-containing protein [Schinkia azotoformans]MEC1741170.1 NETI motif-containing protein [Schinkia azotoformans]